MARRSPPPPEGSDAAEQEKAVARALENVVVVLDHPKDLVNIAGVVRAEHVVTHRFPLAEAGRAYRAAAEDRSVVKAMVTFDGNAS